LQVHCVYLHSCAHEPLSCLPQNDSNLEYSARSRPLLSHCNHLKRLFHRCDVSCDVLYAAPGHMDVQCDNAASPQEMSSDLIFLNAAERYAGARISPHVPGVTAFQMTRQSMAQSFAVEENRLRSDTKMSGLFVFSPSNY